MNEHISKLERHCAPKEMYDDGGYCDTKIKKYGVYYIRFLPDGADTHCPECTVNLILATINSGDKFEYEDCWFGDWEEITGRKSCNLNSNVNNLVRK